MDATENLNFTDLKTEPEVGVFAEEANNDTKTTATEIRASATPDVLPVNECEHKNRTHWLHSSVGWIEKCLDCGREW